MRHRYALFAGMLLALFAASHAKAMDATTRQSDLGAGPIVAHVTACLMANRA